MHLTATEFSLLRILLLNAGRVVSQAQTPGHVWQYDFAGESAIIESFVSTLRKKVDTREPKLIQPSAASATASGSRDDAAPPPGRRGGRPRRRAGRRRARRGRGAADPGGAAAGLADSPLWRGHHAPCSSPRSAWRGAPRSPGSATCTSAGRGPTTDSSRSSRRRPTPGSFPGCGPVRPAGSRDPADAATRRLGITLGLTGTVIASVVGLLLWWVDRLGLRPIAQMTEAADAITAGDTGRRVPPGPPGTEAGRLGEALNAMIETTAATQERMRRVVADASHELRTPLTTLQGCASLHASRPPGPLGAAGRAEVDDAMRRIGDEAARMRRLVEGLLDLAGLDEGRGLRREPVDLGPLLGDPAGTSVTVRAGAGQDGHGAHRGRRCRTRHPRRAPAPPVRPLLPRRQRPLDRQRRNRPGAGGRGRHRAGPRGVGGGGLRAGPRHRRSPHASPAERRALPGSRVSLPPASR